MKRILRLEKHGNKWAIFDTQGVSLYMDVYVNEAGHLCIAQAPTHKVEMTIEEIHVIRPLVSFFLDNGRLPETIEELQNDINARALLGSDSLDFKQAIDIRKRVMGYLLFYPRLIWDYLRSVRKSRSR